MLERSEHTPDAAGDHAQSAEAQFKAALLQARVSRESIGQVEFAAAQYCRELRRQGEPPERTLRMAKRVIHDAIDGDDSVVAERAVQSCIQHYYRTE